MVLLLFTAIQNEKRRFDNTSNKFRAVHNSAPCPPRIMAKIEELITAGQEMKPGDLCEGDSKLIVTGLLGIRHWHEKTIYNATIH